MPTPTLTKFTHLSIILKIMSRIPEIIGVYELKNVNYDV